jgi:hypothetical protein
MVNGGSRSAWFAFENRCLMEKLEVANRTGTLFALTYPNSQLLYSEKSVNEAPAAGFCSLPDKLCRVTKNVG